MLHYKLTIPGEDNANSIDISIFPMPVLDSRMYIIPCFPTDSNLNKRELLIVDPCLWDEEDDDTVRQICCDSDHATVLVTHSHYDHIAGVNRLREFMPVTLYATDLCDRKMQDSHKNLAAYSMALVMDKTEERQKYCERCFDFNYGCKADEIYEDSLWLCPNIKSPYKNPNIKSPDFVDSPTLHVRTIYAPGHSDCSQCIELHYSSGLVSGVDTDDISKIETSLLAVFTGDSLVNGHDVITRFPTGSKKVFRETTEPYLRSLPDDVIILPGHGDPAPLHILCSNDCELVY